MVDQAASQVDVNQVVKNLEQRGQSAVVVTQANLQLALKIIRVSQGRKIEGRGLKKVNLHWFNEKLPS